MASNADHAFAILDIVPIGVYGGVETIPRGFRDGGRPAWLSADLVLCTSTLRGAASVTRSYLTGRRMLAFATSPR